MKTEEKNLYLQSIKIWDSSQEKTLDDFLDMLINDDIDVVSVIPVEYNNENDSMQLEKAIIICKPNENYKTCGIE
jgi:hypothetical protein